MFPRIRYLSSRRKVFVLFVGTAIGLTVWLGFTSPVQRFDMIDSADTNDQSSQSLASFNARQSEPLQKRDNSSSVWFQDSLMYGVRKPGPVYLTLGIPSLIRATKDRYIVRTLNLLIRHSTEEDRKEMLIVIFLGDFNETLRQEAGLFLYNKYKTHVDSGFIQIIKANKAFYPDFDKLKKMSVDPLSKVKWRSKQNFDFAYMMLYSQSLSQFYLQLEDDVVTVPSYFTSIKSFIGQQQKAWVCLEFCELGFIAKLYHSYHLEKLARMLMAFHDKHPNDVTYLRFNTLMSQPKRIVIKPAIFDHVGVHSSMPLKMNSLRDKTFKADPKDIEDSDPDFKAPARVSPFPPAKLSCSVKQYDQYKPEQFYSGAEKVFFAMKPKQDDLFTIVFDEPQHMSAVEMVTGHDLYPDDYAREAQLQIGTSADSSNPKKRRCTDITQSATFNNGIAKIQIIPRDPPITCVHMVFTKSQNNWILITKLSMEFHKR